MTRSEKIAWGKNEINLGTLGLDPLTRLGLKTRIGKNGNTFYEAIQVCYKDKITTHYALSIDPKQK